MLGNVYEIRDLFDKLEALVTKLAGGKTGNGSILDFRSYRKPLNDDEKEQLRELK